jgi:hypothetical protein
MYLTQGGFHGKTGPMDPARKIPENPSFEDRYYPNPWMEDRNLRSIHKRVTSINASQSPNFKGTLLEKSAEND